MSQAKQIETPYGNVWIEKIAFSRTREQLHIYAHADKALSYAEFAKIQAHLILQTGQENTLVSFRMPISNEREIARLCVEYSKKEMRSCCAFWSQSYWKYDEEKKIAYCAFEESNLKDVIQMMPGYEELLRFVQETTGGCHLFFVEKEKLSDPVPCTELVDFSAKIECERAPKPDEVSRSIERTGELSKAKEKQNRPIKARPSAKVEKTTKTRSLLGEPFFPKKTDDLSMVTLELGRVNLEGIALSVEARKKRSKDESIVSFLLTNYYGTVNILASMENKAAAHAVEVLSKKKRVFVRGIVRLDTYTRQEVVWANQISVYAVS